MIYYKTTLFTYNEFIKENNTNRLSKSEKLDTSIGVVNFMNINKVNEIFDSKLDKLEYNEEEYKHAKYPNEENIIYYFKSKSNI